MLIKYLVGQSVEKKLPIELLKPGEYQPRHVFNKQALEALAKSIKDMGILTPILVRPLDAQQYEIIAGERRW